MTEKSPADFIGQYLKIRSYIDAETKKFEAAMEPYKAAMTSIENHMLNLLNTQADGAGKSSISTPVGTCYRKLMTSIKVADREAWMDFIFDGRREGFITNHVPKDAVSEYIEQFNTQPPGLEVVPFYKVTFNSPRSE